MQLLAAAPEAATAFGRGYTALHLAAIGGSSKGVELCWNAGCSYKRLRQQNQQLQHPQPVPPSCPPAAPAEGNAAAVAQLLAAAPGATALGCAQGKGATPLLLALRPRTAEGPDGLAAVRLLLAAGPGEAAAHTLAQAVHDHHVRERALRLLPELVALWALPPAAWAELPRGCAGLEAALPAVLARSEAEAALLVGRLPAEARERLRCRVLCLARLQRRAAALLPVPVLQRVLSLAAVAT